MSSPVHSRHLGKVLCEALGISAEHVREIRLDVAVDDAVVVVVERFLGVDEVPRVLEVLTRYDLIPRDGTRAFIGGDETGKVDTTAIIATNRTYAKVPEVAPR